MELKRFSVPFEAEEMLSFLADIFGEEERALESPQLLGEETPYNTDIVYQAYEGGMLLGAVHATIPKHDCQIAGLSAMFTTPAARGKGVGKLLFRAILDELDESGVRAVFLGTENPIAENMYASFGFRYLYGSAVMIRTNGCDAVSFFKERFSTAEGSLSVTDGSADARIPIIPLALSRLAFKVYDANVSIAPPDIMTQGSCMGLFPRYASLKDRGAYYTAYDTRGVLGAVSTAVKNEEGGCCFDLFFAPTFEGAAPLLLDRAIQFAKGKKIYMNIAECDEKKAALARALGFAPSDSAVISIKDALFPSKLFVFGRK